MSEQQRKARIAGAVCITIGTIVATIVMFLYFYLLYNCLPGWPWQAWWGIPAFCVYTILTLFGGQVCYACISAGKDFIDAAKNTEKKTDGYESPIIKV